MPVFITCLIWGGSWSGLDTIEISGLVRSESGVEWLPDIQWLDFQEFDDTTCQYQNRC
jgi:hypothetical protein